MKTLQTKFGVIENMGIVDRLLRTLVGLTLTVPIIIAAASGDRPSWEIYASMAATYMLLTGMLGWDPFYALFHARSCDLSERNRCGSFQYEADAMLGHHPDHDKGYETHALKPEERVKGVDVGGYLL